MDRVLLLDVVGLTAALLGPDTPQLSALAARGACAPMSAVLPAVTLSAQATMLTGTMPGEHGAVGNGWFFRELGEVWFWRQSNALVHGPKLYERARDRDPAFTCAKLFWWWNMGARVDWSITPRPFYPADGRKIPAVYGWPDSFPLELERALGPFPFFDFWGPRAGLPSSAWIAAAAARTLREQRPTLTMAYLPHLDYAHQRFGPDDERSRAAVREVDELCGALIAEAERQDAHVVVVSEYGIEPVERPVELNRALRREGLLAVRPTPTGEVLDTYASRAFAVTDHQVAHVYAHDAEARAHAHHVLRNLDGVAQVLEGPARRAAGLEHERAGDLVAVAERGAWFPYYYWLDDHRAPDFARTVDIHRKPGYDPCELFLDPRLSFPRLKLAWRLAQKAVGQRVLMDVVPLDPRLVKGSHGRLPDDPAHGPVFLCSRPFGEERGACGPSPARGTVAMTSVPGRVLRLVFPG